MYLAVISVVRLKRFYTHRKLLLVVQQMTILVNLMLYQLYFM